MQKFKIMKDDIVVVTTGKYKSETGRVLQVLREKNRVLIEKVNIVKRQVKPTAERAGGTVEKEASVHISNVALWNSEEKRAVKVGWKRAEDGSKVRYDKKTNAVIPKPGV
jgi:large subunit ribosomal protein L24